MRLRLALSALRRGTTVVPLGDLDAFVPETDFDAGLAAEGVDVAAQSVVRNMFDLTTLRGADAILANVQKASQLILRNAPFWRGILLALPLASTPTQRSICYVCPF